MYSRWIGDGVGVIDTGGYATDGTVASYVVKGRASTALIDVGYSPNWERTKAGLSELGVPRESVSRIFLTHVHLDHAGAACDAVGYLPNAKLTAHERAIRHLIDPSRIVQATRAGFGDQAVHVGDMRAVQPERMEPAKEESYDLGGHSLEPIFTPGHMPGHVSLLLDGSTMFSGDALCVRKEHIGLVPAGSPPVYDVVAALKSIDRLEEFRPKTLLAPHFGKYPAAAGELALHREAIQEWRDSIGRMVDEGLTLQQACVAVREGVLRKAGLKPSDLDDYTMRVLLDKLLGMTVEGYMGYLLAGKM